MFRGLSSVVFSACFLVSASILVAQDDDPAEDPVMVNLQKVQDVVGTWSGSGKSDDSKGWDESIDCQWKFNPTKKTVSLYMHFKLEKEAEGRLLEEGMLTYDPMKKLYRFKAYPAGEQDSEEAIEFEGAAKSDTNLVLDRVNKGDAKDKLDRLDLKILNEGDRLVYAFQRRLGSSKNYKPYAQVSLNRKGTSLAGGAANGPKCIVTGGTGTMPVSFDGKTYYVCCTGCRDAFNADPKKFIARLEKK